MVVEFGSIGVADTLGATRASNNILPRTDFLFTASINCGIGGIWIVSSSNQLIVGETLLDRQSESIGDYIKKY
jgi:hypothetical protein